MLQTLTEIGVMGGHLSIRRGTHPKWLSAPSGEPYCDEEQAHCKVTGRLFKAILASVPVGLPKLTRVPQLNPRRSPESHHDREGVRPA